MTNIAVWIGLSALLVLLACSPQTLPTPPSTAPQEPVSSAQASTQGGVPVQTPLLQIVEAAKKEGQVTLYTFQFTGDVGQAMAKAFEGKYGVKVGMVTGVGTGLMERIQAESRARKYIADGLDTSLVMMVAAKKDGLTQPWGDLPVLAEKGVWFAEPTLDSEGHLLSAQPGLYTPYINTTLVKATEEPRSYKDFLDPRWNGKIAVTDERSAAQTVILLLAQVIDEDFLLRLGKQQLKVGATARDSLGLLLRGEAAAWLPGSDSQANPMIVRGAPIKPIDMEEGVVAAKATVRGLVANAPHPNASRLFQNWLLSAEGQNLYHNIRGTLPMRTDVRDYRPAISQIKHKRIVWQTLENAVKASQLQREGYGNKLLGLE